MIYNYFYKYRINMKIIVPVCNNPRFIEMQIATFRKFIKQEYEFIIFNDAKKFPDYSNFNDITIFKQIEDTCTLLNIPCINVPNDQDSYKIDNASNRHARTMNFIFSFMKKYPDQYWIIDSDMFIIRDFDLHKYNEYDCAVIVHKRPNNFRYIWPNIFYFNMHLLKYPELVNFNTQLPGDSGGATWEWLSKYEKEAPSRICFMNSITSCSWGKDTVPDYLVGTKIIDFCDTDIRNQDNKYWCEIYIDTILHYRAGSNWNKEGRDIHNKLTDRLYSTIMELS